MYLHGKDGHIKKYNTIDEIINDYYIFRLELYVLRKTYILKMLKNELDILHWKIKFLEYVITGKLKVFENKKARTKNDIVKDLEKLSFPKLALKIKDDADKSQNDEEADAEEDADNADEEKIVKDDGSYNYILNMPFLSITEDELDKLKEEHKKKSNEYSIYENTKIEQMWYNELDEFESAYEKWYIENVDVEDTDNKKKGAKKKAARKRPT